MKNNMDHVIESIEKAALCIDKYIDDVINENKPRLGSRLFNPLLSPGTHTLSSLSNGKLNDMLKSVVGYKPLLSLKEIKQEWHSICTKQEVLTKDNEKLMGQVLHGMLNVFVNLPIVKPLMYLLDAAWLLIESAFLMLKYTNIALASELNQVRHAFAQMRDEVMSVFTKKGLVSQFKKYASGVGRDARSQYQSFKDISGVNESKMRQIEKQLLDNVNKITVGGLLLIVNTVWAIAKPPITLLKSINDAAMRMADDVLQHGKRHAP